MATITWSGAIGDGNFGTAGNWVGGSAPVGGDSVIFPSGNSASVTAGLATGIAVVNVLVQEGYTGNIGTASSALVFSSATLIDYAGRGQFCKIGSGGTIALANIDVNSGNSFYASSGTWTLINASGKGGTIDIDAAAVLTALNGSSSSVAVTIGYNATGVTTIKNIGSITSSRSIATYKGSGPGSLTTKLAAAITTGADITKDHLFNHQSSGTITLLDVFPGGKFPNAICSSSYTITTVNEWAGSLFNDNPPGVTVTIGTRNKIGKNGNLLSSPGSGI